MPVSTSRSASSSRTEAASKLDLLLLDDHGHRLRAAPCLQVEHAEARLSDGVGGDALDGSEVHRAYPRRFLRPRDPRAGVATSHGGAGPSGPNRLEAAGVVDQEDTDAAAPVEMHDGDGCRVHDRALEAIQRGALPGGRAGSGRCRRASPRRHVRGGGAARWRRRRRRPAPGPRRSSRPAGSETWTERSAPPSSVLVRRRRASGLPVQVPASISMRPGRSTIGQTLGGGEGFDGLHASLERARVDGGESHRREALNEELRLHPPSMIERDAAGRVRTASCRSAR